MDPVSGWLVKRPRKKDRIMYIGRETLQIKAGNNYNYSSIVDHNFSSFMYNTEISFQNYQYKVLSSITAWLPGRRARSKTEKLIGKVYKHVFGQAYFKNVKLLLEQNNLLSTVTEEFVQLTRQQCTTGWAMAPRQPSLNALTSSPYKSFNDVWYVDHFYYYSQFYLDSIWMLHCIHGITCLPAVFILSAGSFNKTIHGFRTCWLY